MAKRVLTNIKSTYGAADYDEHPAKKAKKMTNASDNTPSNNNDNAPSNTNGDLKVNAGNRFKPTHVTTQEKEDISNGNHNNNNTGFHSVLNTSALTNDLFYQMARWLTPQDLCPLAIVCRRFYLLFSHDRAWEQFCPEAEVTSMSLFSGGGKLPTKNGKRTGSHLSYKRIFRDWWQATRKIFCMRLFFNESDKPYLGEYTELLSTLLTTTVKFGFEIENIGDQSATLFRLLKPCPKSGEFLGIDTSYRWDFKAQILHKNKAKRYRFSLNISQMVPHDVDQDHKTITEENLLAIQPGDTVNGQALFWKPGKAITMSIKYFLDNLVEISENNPKKINASPAKTALEFLQKHKKLTLRVTVVYVCKSNSGTVVAGNFSSNPVVLKLDSTSDNHPDYLGYKNSYY